MPTAGGANPHRICGIILSICQFGHCHNLQATFFRRHSWAPAGIAWQQGGTTSLFLMSGKNVAYFVSGKKYMCSKIRIYWILFNPFHSHFPVVPIPCEGSHEVHQWMLFVVSVLGEETRMDVWIYCSHFMSFYTKCSTSSDLLYLQQAFNSQVARPNEQGTSDNWEDHHSPLQNDPTH